MPTLESSKKTPEHPAHLLAAKIPIYLAQRQGMPDMAERMLFREWLEADAISIGEGVIWMQIG